MKIDLLYDTTISVVSYVVSYIYELTYNKIHIASSHICMYMHVCIYMLLYIAYSKFINLYSMLYHTYMNLDFNINIYIYE